MFRAVRMCGIRRLVEPVTLSGGVLELFGQLRDWL
jgi:hypothetical protein